MPGLRGEYMGMALTVDDLDGENLTYFGHCAKQIGRAHV